MPLRDNLLSKVNELNTIKNQLKKQEIVDETQYTEYRKKTIQFQINQSNLKQKITHDDTLTLLSNTRTTPRFHRVLIGSGIAATLVYQEIPPNIREKNKYDPSLPGVIAVNDPDNPHTWIKERKRLMGQPAKIQTPKSLSVHSEDLVFDEEIPPTNPYQYVVAEDFNQALIQSQVDLNMPIISLKIKSIESINNHTLEDKWEHPDCKYRLTLSQSNLQFKYIYTDAIDLCAGLGSSKKLTAEQIDPSIAKKLIENKSLVYAQDKIVDLHGEVLLYGGSAINSAWATEILSQPTHSTLKIIGLVSRDTKALEAINTLSRFISSTCHTTLNLLAGDLKNIHELPNGKLAITFSAPKDSGSFTRLYEGQIIYCDQLVVAIGQVPPEITNGLKDFDECIYDPTIASKVNNIDDAPSIPLGTHSKDGSIIAWGALGTLGIGLSNSEVFTKKIEAHANSYPYESQALGGIFRMSRIIPQMAKQLIAKGFFPNIPQHDSQQFLIPDINQATLEEIAALIDHPCELERKKYAEQIIQLRCQIVCNAQKEAPGIHDFAQITSIISDINLLKRIQWTYFPFSYAPESNRIKPNITNPIKVSDKRAIFFAAVPKEGDIKEHHTYSI